MIIFWIVQTKRRTERQERHAWVRDLNLQTPRRNRHDPSDMEEALADERNLGDGSWQPRLQLRQHQGSEKPTSGDEAASGPDDAPAKESLMPSSLSNGDVQFNSQTPAHANESTTARREFQSGSDPVEGSSDDGDEGFEVKFDGDHDPISPRSLPKTRKWLITMIVCLSATCVWVTALLFLLSLHGGLD